MATRRTGALLSNVPLRPKLKQAILSGEYVKNLYQVHNKYGNILHMNGNIHGFEVGYAWNIWNAGKRIDLPPWDLLEYTIVYPGSYYWHSAVLPTWVSYGDWVYYDRLAGRFSFFVKGWITSNSTSRHGRPDLA